MSGDMHRTEHVGGKNGGGWWGKRAIAKAKMGQDHGDHELGASLVSTLNGIDVSHWQATTPPLTGLSFLFAKASDGAGGPDSRYPQHIANARAAGLLVGAYHFAVKGDGAAQARAFLTAAGKVDFYALDREGNDPMTLAQAAAFINTVQAAGHKCGLYGSESGFPSVGQDWNWVANWSRVPAIPWTFHQYRGSPLDLDHFNGDMTALRSLAGIHPAPAPDVPAGTAWWVVAHGLRFIYHSHNDVLIRSKAGSLTFNAYTGPNRDLKTPKGISTFRHVLSGPHTGQWVQISDAGLTWKAVTA